MEQFHTEMKQLQTQMKQLQVMLKDMDHSNKTLEEELQKASEKACLTVEENGRLKSRLDKAEAEVVQRQAGSAEQDYEEVVQLLEAEIRDLKSQLASKRQAQGVEPTKAELLELNRKLTIIDCQLRKSELSRKHLEIANKKLLGFAQDVHKVLTTPSLFGRETGSSRSTPSTNNMDTLASLPDPAFQLVAKAKELMEGISNVEAKDSACESEVTSALD